MPNRAESGHVPSLVCNCAEVSPTMPTCRGKHLPTCPMSVLDFLATQQRESAEWAASVPVRSRRTEHDHSEPMRAWLQGYAYAMGLAARWMLTQDAGS